MKKRDIYLDTSIWNYLFADDVPEKKAITIEFFSRVKKGEYNIYIGPTVFEEIRRTKDKNKLDLLLQAVEKYQPIVFELTEEVHNLAEKYIIKKVVPERKRDDAYHISYAVCNKVDILLSWNYRHLANIDKKAKVMAVNLLEGYLKEMEFITPYEVLSDETG